MSDYSYKIIKHESIKREFHVSVAYDTFVKFKDQQAKMMGKNVKVPGFRPGKAPKHMIESVLGGELTNRSLRGMLSKITYEIIKKEDLSPISQLKYDLKDIPKSKDTDNTIEYTVTFFNFPEFKIPDFTKLGIKEEESIVEDKDIDKVVERFYRDIEKLKESDKFDIKRVTDQWVKGTKIDKAQTVEDLRNLMEKNIKQQKIQNSEDKLLNDLFTQALPKLKIDIPFELIENDIKLREDKDKKKIKDLGLKWEDWLEQQKTDMKVLRSKWKEKSEKIYKQDFLVIAIAKENDLVVKADEVDQIIGAYANQKKMNEEEIDRLRSRIIDDMTREKVFKWILSDFRDKKK